jgi:two-component system, chemotaxis family, protein-glutamate methylesterase/glutaminase
MRNDLKADIVVIGASAGGVEALEQVVSGLQPDFPAAVFVTLHLPARGVSRLPEILSRQGPLPASHPLDGTSIEKGHIYVAPPDRHLLVQQNRIQLSAGPKENRARPAINAMFRSAALVYGPRVIGVILTGSLDDGSVGLWEIKQHGGRAIVQDPADAMFPDMPRNARDTVPVDHVVPLRELVPLLTQLVSQPVVWQGHKKGEPMKDQRRTALTCPDCRGPISASRQGSMTELICRVGHRYSPMTFIAAHADTRERTLWAAVVALEEGAEVALEVASHSRWEAQHLLEQEASNNMSAAGKIRALLDALIQENAGHVIHESQDERLAS